MSRRNPRAVEARRNLGARLRAEVAQVAARLMAEEGVHDFAEAKSRAVDRLGADGRNTLPRNQEIEAELRAYQALFQADTQPVWLAAKRRTALAVMRRLAPLEPRLAGAVLRGTAVEDGEITLHVFADAPETVARLLIDLDIPWALDAAVVRFGSAAEEELPVYRFRVEAQAVRLVVFPADGPRVAPRSPIDGKPMARADAAAVEELVGAGPARDVPS